MGRRVLVGLLLLGASGVVGASGVDAGHVSVALSYDAYGSEAFTGGRDGSDETADFSFGGMARYVREPGGRLAWLPALGIGVSHWSSGLEGNCCGFEGEDVDVSFTSLDLMVAKISPSGDVREVWYLLGGVTSVDVDAGFDTDGVEGITDGRDSAPHVGFGFFSGEAGGFTGGLELRHTETSDFGVTTLFFTAGVGF